MRTAELPGFLPSRHGFRFVNRWPSGPAFEWVARYIRVGIGDVAEGLCGGMCFATADRFVDGEAPPADIEPPPAGSALFREIVRRQFDSLELGFVPLRFWWTAARVGAGAWPAVSQARQWRSIRADLDAGRPAMLGLVRSAAVDPLSLTRNHQVLSYGYEAQPDRATIRIYDPNHPGRDDVTLELRLEAGRFSLEQSSGEPLLALLRLPYRAARSRAPPARPAG